MARNLEKDLLPVLFQAKMQLQSMQFEQLLVEQTTNSLCWIWEPCYGSQFCLTNGYAWGCSATQPFRIIFWDGKNESLTPRLNLSCRPRVWERTLAKQKAWFSDFSTWLQAPNEKRGQVIFISNSLMHF